MIKSGSGAAFGFSLLHHRLTHLISCLGNLTDRGRLRGRTGDRGHIYIIFINSSSRKGKIFTGPYKKEIFAVSDNSDLGF